MEIGEIITMLAMSMGALVAGIPGFYLLYYFEKGGTWKDLVNTQKNRRTLAIASGISLAAGIVGGIALSMGQKESLSLLWFLVPVTIGLGLYFLMVSIFYRPNTTIVHE